MKAYIHHWKLGSAVKGTDKARWEEDYELIENEGLFQEYLEMGECHYDIIQHQLIVNS